MKIELLPCFYSTDGCFKLFSINCWYVGQYPLTYTAQECAEVWCEVVGWKLIFLYKEGDHLDSYSMRVEIPEDEVAERTILSNHYDSTDLGSPPSFFPPPRLRGPVRGMRP